MKESCMEYTIVLCDGCGWGDIAVIRTLTNYKRAVRCARKIARAVNSTGYLFYVVVRDLYGEDLYVAGKEIITKDGKLTVEKHR